MTVSSFNKIEIQVLSQQCATINFLCSVYKAWYKLVYKHLYSHMTFWSWRNNEVHMNSQNISEMKIFLTHNCEMCMKMQANQNKLLEKEWKNLKENTSHEKLMWNRHVLCTMIKITCYLMYYIIKKRGGAKNGGNAVRKF